MMMRFSQEFEQEMVRLGWEACGPPTVPLPAPKLITLLRGRWVRIPYKIEGKTSMLRNDGAVETYIAAGFLYVPLEDWPEWGTFTHGTPPTVIWTTPPIYRTYGVAYEKSTERNTKDQFGHICFTLPQIQTFPVERRAFALAVATNRMTWMKYTARDPIRDDRARR